MQHDGGTFIGASDEICNPLENSSTVRTRRSERYASSSRCDEEETDCTVAENREERSLDHGGLDAHSNTGSGRPLLVN
ncbi:hypothetical protein NQZ68_012999 [Dissostichus eleginoides]|nr:hypothetical protein NQZ68_012999 [Dissostichus eleginoides]